MNIVSRREPNAEVCVAPERRAYAVVADTSECQSVRCRTCSVWYVAACVYARGRPLA